MKKNDFNQFLKKDVKKHFLRYVKIYSHDAKLDLLSSILKPTETVIYPKSWMILSYLGSFCLFIAGIIILSTDITSALFIFLTSIVLLPQFHRLLEKYLIFNFTWKIKSYLVTTLLALSLIPHISTHIKKYQLEVLQAKLEKERIEKAIQIKKEERRLDSLSNVEFEKYHSLIESYSNIDSFNLASLYLDTALQISRLPIDRVEILYKYKANTSLNLELYKDALDYLIKLKHFQSFKETITHRLKEATCHYHLGHNALLIESLENLIKFDSVPYNAIEYYDTLFNLSMEDHIRLLTFRANNNFKNKKFDDALTDYKQLSNYNLQADVKSTVTNNKANCLLAIGDTTSALSTLAPLRNSGDEIILRTYVGILLYNVRNYKNYKNYSLAVKEYSRILHKVHDPIIKSTIYYERSICHVGLEDTVSAVKDLRKAIKLGHEGAEAYHNKINPEIEVDDYTISICKDGHRSRCSGKGCCSHHGGVAYSKLVKKKLRIY
jgi:hypothetical protein